MRVLRLFQVDAFTRRLFAGNPAAIVALGDACPLERWPDDATLQAIAAESNLSETAFFSPQGGSEAIPEGTPEATPARRPLLSGSFRLRWFAPCKEISLCGHATLATAFVIFHELGYTEDTVRFQTQSGQLTVCRTGARTDPWPAVRLPWTSPPRASRPHPSMPQP